MANKRQIGIIGLGLIGGSLALALKDHRVLGWDSDEVTCEYAQNNGFCEVAEVSGMKDCDVVFVCVPVAAMKSALERAYGVLGDSVIISDVASVKAPFELAKGRYVGGHPMAGTEKGGIASSKPHLFQNAYWVITSTGSDADVVTGIVKSIGALPLYMTAADHDRAVAMYSHVPHAVAYALASAALDSSVKPIAGSGFLDTTRIAKSDEKFWTEVFSLNSANVSAGISAYISELTKLNSFIERGDRDGMMSYISSARQKREALERADLGGEALYVDLVDRVGEFERVTGMIARAGINVKSIALVPGREDVSGALRLEFETAADRAAAEKVLKKG